MHHIKPVKVAKSYLNGKSLPCTIHPYFQIIARAVVIRKGVYSDLDSYSAFADNADLNETQLYRDLKKRCITDIFVCGIATDVCVGKYIRSKTACNFHPKMITFSYICISF